MRIVFMGTPDFSVPALTALVEAGHDVIAVVTQPDKPKGRGKLVQMTPVKEKALEYGIPVYQPVKARDPEFVSLLKEMKPDAMVVAAFGQLLPKTILDIPKYGCVNIHASLLPEYRGAAPIQFAVINGESVSGITTMMMAPTLDTGDILDQESVALDEKETGGSLHDKLSAIGGRLIIKTLKKLEDGTAVRTVQDEEKMTYFGMLKKSMGDIDWNQDAASIERLIRGLNPWPSAYTSWEGKTIKLRCTGRRVRGSLWSGCENRKRLSVCKNRKRNTCGEGTAASGKEAYGYRRVSARIPDCRRNRFRKERLIHVLWRLNGILF